MRSFLLCFTDQHALILPEKVRLQIVLQALFLWHV